MSRAILLLFLFLPPSPSRRPNLTANITHVASPTDFDIDGLHVHLTPSTTFESRKGEAFTPLTTPAPFIGQFADVWGKLDRKTLSIFPDRIVFYEPRPYVVTGMALIDRVPPGTAQAHLLRADGRILEISASTLDHPVALPAGAPPPATDNDLHTNVWVEYHGLRRSDGIVAVDQASFETNTLDKAEDKLRTRNEFKPSTTPPATNLSDPPIKGAVDYNHIAPWKDDLLQSRIDRIGQSLIPIFQRELPPADPTRIHFRFELVDQPKAREAKGLPSGIVLVPYQIVARLPDDSMLAAILANTIAEIFEKQTYRLRGAIRGWRAASIATSAASIIPGAGIVGGLTGLGGSTVTGGIADNIVNRAEQQAGRVALTLMDDAGYDIDQAPEAWWLLAAKPGEDPHLHEPPYRASWQYDELGTTWQPANRHPTKPRALAPSP